MKASLSMLKAENVDGNINISEKKRNHQLIETKSNMWREKEMAKTVS
jgi:hypothetical protein